MIPALRRPLRSIASRAGQRMTVAEHRWTSPQDEERHPRKEHQSTRSRTQPQASAGSAPATRGALAPSLQGEHWHRRWARRSHARLGRRTALALLPTAREQPHPRPSHPARYSSSPGSISSSLRSSPLSTLLLPPLLSPPPSAASLVLPRSRPSSLPFLASSPPFPSPLSLFPLPCPACKLPRCRPAWLPPFVRPAANHPRNEASGRIPSLRFALSIVQQPSARTSPVLVCCRPSPHHPR